MKLFLCLVLPFFVTCSKPKPNPASPQVSAKTNDSPWVDEYKEIAQKLEKNALKDETSWKRLEVLTDDIGHRLSGSKSLERAIDWAENEMRKAGLDNVRKEPVQVPHWQRGSVESAEMFSPVNKELTILGIGGSVATPKGGLRAEVVLINGFDELQTKDIKGKAVLFNHKMPHWTKEHGSGYGEAYVYRTQGASKAAKHGALFVLVRSLTAHSLNSPHTGSLGYAEDAKKIPAAAISTEDADHIERLSAKGKTIKVLLNMNPITHPDATSYNVIGEITGQEKPEEIVLLAAHIDSWDVGSGAHDDGGGCMAMLGAMESIKKLNLKPKRTIRLVLFTNEENGLRGAKQYSENVKDQIKNHVMAIESDTGVFAPVGVRVQNSDVGKKQLEELMPLLASLNATEITDGFSGADIMPIVNQGVPGLGMAVHGEHYFDIHHTEADTLDKVDKDEFRKNIAVASILAFVIADMKPRFGQ